MPWSKYTPHEPERPPDEAESASAARRAWLLRWGMWVSQAMFLLGLGLMLYWGFLRGR